MKNIFIIIFFLSISCHNESKKSIVTTTENTKSDLIYKRPMQHYQYIDIQETKRWALEKIKQKYRPVQEEDFYLNKGPISEFRIELYNFFNEQERELPVLIKEITWKKSESENYTIWFRAKGTDWIRVHSYVWSKYWEF